VPRYANAMAREIRFEKWEGLGNDFIVVDQGLLPADLSDAAVQHITDRRRGVGGDGILLVGRGETPSMIVRNADGSRPEMCGNGLRCVAAYLVAQGAQSTLAVQTDAGLRACEVLENGDVSIDMGVATYDEELVVSHGGREHRFMQASMGNPHAITFEPASAAIVDEVSRVAEHARPGRTNVEWVTDRGDRLGVVVWERGVGYTEACGTGACAVAAVACRLGKRRFDEDVVVRLPGGDLVIRVTEHSRVTMRGPAKKAFSGMFTVD